MLDHEQPTSAELSIRIDSNDDRLTVIDGDLNIIGGDSPIGTPEDRAELEAALAAEAAWIPADDAGEFPVVGPTPVGAPEPALPRDPRGALDAHSGEPAPGEVPADEARTDAVEAPGTPLGRAWWRAPLVAGVGALLVANLALALVAWRTLASVESVADELALQAQVTGADARVPLHARSAVAGPRSEATLEALRTLDRARELLTLGEFVLARRTLCELLAVVDALDDPARTDVEAGARYLLADAWRLEAETLVAASGGAR